jgi:TolB-like protein/Flp pilus assembly protein TadD
VIVVTPFENRSTDSADVYIAATLTEDVTTALSASHAVRLVSASSARQHAEYALAASVRRSRGLVRVSARLLRSGSGEILWTSGFDRPAEQGAGIADTLASLVLARLGVRSVAPVRRARAVDPAAYDLYLRGRYYASRRTEAGLARAVDLLRQAVARDSSFALAWARLAQSLHVAAVWRLPIPGIPAENMIEREMDAAERALLNDSTRPEIWLARAYVAEDVDPTDRASALRAIRRALELDSLSADAWNDYGFALDEAGDTAGAVMAERRAIALDPGDPRLLTSLALHHYWARRYDSASVWADSIIATDPTFLSGRRMAGTVALARGRAREAESQFAAARNIGPGPERIWAIGGLACAAVARGDTAAAHLFIMEAESLTPTVDPALHSAVFIAWGYTALGTKERALDWLERYRARGDLHFQRHLQDDAPLDPLRGEPRFQALMTTRH